MYICGRSGEYSVTYPARHLLFHQCVDPSTGYYGTMLYFTCDNYDSLQVADRVTYRTRVCRYTEMKFIATACIACNLENNIT